MKAAIVSAIALLALHCQGALPANDNFAVRTALFGTNTSAAGNNIGATKEVDEPDPNFTGGKSVWWTWTAPADGYVTITTTGSSFDTTLAVYTGIVLSNLTLVTFNDTELDTSIVTFNAGAGSVYQIQVDGCDNDFYETNNAEGNISLQLTLGPVQTPPANDNFANRITLSGTHLSNVPGSNLGASAEPGEPFHADTLGMKSVWWTWTAPSSGGLTLTTQGSVIDTVLAIYTGNSVSNLTLVGANDEDPVFGYQSIVTCNVVSNVTYQIVVDGFEGAEGDLRLRLDLGTAFPVPANDNFANRIILTGSNIATNGSNVGATYEPNEPMHLVTFGGKSVWWSWTAPASGGVTLTVSNNALDTLVCVYKGTSLANLVFVAGNDEDFFLSPAVEGDSTAFFNATNGTTYQIVVDGVDGASGNFDLRLALGTADPAPANDNFANRIALSGTNVTATGSNLGATMEIDEPLHRGYYGGHSVWWRWTSPGAGFVNIDTTNTVTDVPDTLLAVYTGSALSSLTEIASDNNSGRGNWASRVTFPTRSNVTYQIAVDGVDGDEWDNLRLNIRYTPAAYSLTLTTNPAGAGTVGVSVLPDQGGKYAPGSVVTLTAVPANGNIFTGWTGDIVSTDTPLTLAVNSNKTIVAGFFIPPKTRVWTGASAAGGAWTDSDNWAGGVPNAGDDLIFPPGASRLAANTNDFPNSTTLGSITLGVGGCVLLGNSISLNNGLVSTNDTGTNTVGLSLTLNSNQTFRCNVATTELGLSGNLFLGTRTLTVDNIGHMTISGVISGNGGIVKTSVGTLSLSGSNPNSFAGMTTVNQGTLDLQKIGVAIPGPLTVGDGSGGANADVVRYNANSQIATASAVSILSSGQLDLNSFSGIIDSLTMTGGNVDTGTGILGLNGNLAANASSSQANITGNLSLQGTTRTFNVANGSAAIDLLISAAITNGAGVAGITKSGAGKLQFAGANTYNGTTMVNQGTLAIANSAALGASSQGTIVNNNATLALVGGLNVNGESLSLVAATLQADSGSNTWTGGIALTNTCLFSVATNAGLNLSGSLSGSGAVTKTGDGTLIFSGASANVYSGVTTVNQGTLALTKSISNAVPGALIIGDGAGGSDADIVRLDTAQQIPSGSTLTLNSSGLLNLNGLSYSFGLISGNGHLDLGAATAILTLGANNSSSSFNGVISGAGQLIKAGAGTLTLSANNTYTGQTTINAGQLIVNGQQSNSAVMVNSGALLGGTGRVGALSGGGTISPGTSPGVLSSGNVVFSSNTTFRVELNGTTAGTGYDQLNVGGTVTLAGTLNASLGFTPAISNSFTIIDNNANDAIVGTFAGLPEGSFIVIGGVSLQVSYLAGPGGNNVTLTSVATTAPTISSVSFLPDGTVQVLGLGQSGLTYVLESAAAIASPTIWTPVGSNTATAGGAFQFIDSSALTNPASFYRVRWP